MQQPSTTLRPLPATRNGNGAQIKYFYMADPGTGMSSARVPLPADWAQLTNNKEFLFEGPNRIRVSS